MSEVILDFAEPLLNHATDLNSKKVAISTAILCWNIYLMPEKKRQEEIGKVADNLFKTGMDRKIFEDMASMLFERKRTFFPDINKVIVSYEVLESGDSLRLNVASTYLHY